MWWLKAELSEAGLFHDTRSSPKNRKSYFQSHLKNTILVLKNGLQSQVMGGKSRKWPGRTNVIP
jgi:hypothetical protein